MLSTPDCVKRSAWFPYALVALAALIAEGLSLGAVFYMDDAFHIQANPEVIERFSTSFSGLGRSVTYILWRCAYLLAGDSPMAFHFLNLSIHVVAAALSLALLKSIPKTLQIPGWLEDRWDKVAFWGAMIFATHPMCTEAVNYASQTSIQLVTMFSILTGYLFLEWRRQGGWRLMFGVVIAALLAMHSKEPGIFHIAFVLIFLAVIPAKGRPVTWPRISKKTRIGVLGAAGLITALFTHIWGYLIAAQLSLIQHIYWNWLTQSRLLWSYLRRVLIPVGQSSDHYVPWSVSALDWPGLVSLLLVLLGGGWLLFQALRKRRWLPALCCLALSHLIVRALYNIDEPFVEYRIYPAMPWLSLLMALGLVAIVARWPRWEPIRPMVTMAVVLVFTGLSIHRCWIWNDAERLSANILQQYPMNFRAWCQRATLWDKQKEYQKIVAMAHVPHELAEKVKARNKRHPRSFLSEQKMYAGFFYCQRMIAKAYRELGQIDKALEVSKSAISEMQRKSEYAHPMSLAESLAIRSEIWAMQNKPREAKADLFRSQLVKLTWKLNQEPRRGR